MTEVAFSLRASIYKYVGDAIIIIVGDPETKGKGSRCSGLCKNGNRNSKNY